MGFGQRDCDDRSAEKVTEVQFRRRWGAAGSCGGSPEANGFFGSNSEKLRAVGRNSKAYCAALVVIGGLRFANPPYGLRILATHGRPLKKSRLGVT
jgi:hypothetical protein